MEYRIPIREYGQKILHSVPIQSCSKDFLEKGDCVLDVGANIGTLSIAFSRLVGKSGIVHAFEPNTYLLRGLEQLCKKNNATNVKIHNLGIWSSSKKNLKFYCSAGFSGEKSSFIVNTPGSEEVLMDVTSLDEFSKKNNVIPNFIKIDTERADYHVLFGSSNILKNYHPVVVFEYNYSKDEKIDCIKFLEKFGYRFLDVSLYQEVNSEFYKIPTRNKAPSNIIAIPSKLFSLHYHSLKIEEGKNLIPSNDFRTHPIELKEGRYMVTFHFRGPPQKIASLKALDKNGNILDFNYTTIERLKHEPNSNLILDLDSSVKVVFALIADDYTDMDFNKVSISRITGFNRK